MSPTSFNRILRANQVLWNRFHGLFRPRPILLRNLATSYVRGPSSPPLLTDTLPQFYANRLLPDHASRTALISAHEPAIPYDYPSSHVNPIQRSPAAKGNTYLTWSYEEMDRHIMALAKGLVRLGVQKGDRVGVVMGNCSAYAMLQWACARIGAIIVTINPAYRMSELISTMNLVEVSTLFISSQLRSSNYVDLLTNSLPSISTSSSVQDPNLPSLRNIVLLDNLSYRDGGVDFLKEISKIPAARDFRSVLDWTNDFVTDENIRQRSDSLLPDEVVNLQFTSGTTGAPKAVSLTHRNLLNNAYSIGSCMNLTPDDKICNLASWAHASTIVYASESFNPRAILDTLEAEKCTGVHGVPTHFLGVMREIDEAKRTPGGRTWDLSSLRTGIAAGSTIPIELMRQLIDKLNLTELTIAYGMTETSPVSFQTVPSDSMIKRTETVGRVQPHVTAKIVDSNNEVVPIGVPGELCVSGYLVHQGYWNDPEQSAAVVKRHPAYNDHDELEWMHTGDQAIMDEEGYLRIVGRIKDIIIRGGENLFPVQIENVLTAHESIREAAVVSVPDSVYGEVVGVWIVREGPGDAHQLTPQDVRAWVAQSMNPQNTPAWVWFTDDTEMKRRGHDELPKTGSGKVQKNVLRDWSRVLANNGIGNARDSP